MIGDRHSRRLAVFQPLGINSQTLVRLDLDQFERLPEGMVEAWACDRFCVQIYQHEGHECLCMTRLRRANKVGRYGYSIPWDEMQRLKRECGRGDRWAVEIFPDDRDLVGVENQRYLWLVDPDTLPFRWQRQ